MNEIFKIVLDLFKNKNITEPISEIFKGKEAKRREFEYKMSQLIALELDKELKDLKDARQLQIEALRQDDKFSKHFIYYLTFFLIFATVLISFFPFFLEFPELNKNEIQRATDFLYTVTGARVISFFFGSKITNNNK